MKGEHQRAGRGDADTHHGTMKALSQALGLTVSPLLIDAAADAAFASSIRRLRGEPGTNKGGNV